MAKLVSKQNLGTAKVYDVTVQGTHSFFAYSKQGSPEKAVLAHNCHRMSRDAQDVLLKPLEEKRMVGIFCTTEPEKIRGPIRSRCEEYTIRKITRDDILVRMKKILDLEGVPHEDDAVLTVIDYSGGHVRDVVNRLEMISQMGEINLTNVREYLHLSATSVYYDVLLSLGDPKRVVDLIEQACERVSPEEVSAGISEAAMNSFRLAHKMFADFAYVDKGMGQKVYAMYGNNLLHLADHFLQRRYTSKVALLCDALALSNGLPAPAVTLTAPPIVVTPVVTAPSAEPPITSVGPVQTTSVEPVRVVPAPAQMPPPLKTSGKGGIRSDGVGNLGSSDIAAQTECDVYGVAQEKPRGPSHAKVNIKFQPSASDDDTMMTPAEWRKDFERSLTILSGRG